MKPAPILLAAGVVFAAIPLFGQTFTVTRGSGQVGASPKAYAAAVVKQSYPVGFWAKTGASSLDVELSPDNSLVLLPESEAEIDDDPSRSNPGLQRKVSLKKGKVSLKLNSTAKKNIEVETPTAICGAVGTIFEVNAVSSNFNVISGGVYLASKTDQTFSADAVRGNVTLAVGTQNTAVTGSVSGRFMVNGTPMVTSSAVPIDIAKSVGRPSEAALEVPSKMSTPKATWEIVTEPTVASAQPTTEVVKGSIPAGSYITTPNSNKLVKVTGATKEIHKQYRAAAKREGQLAVQQRMYKAAKLKEPAGLSAQVKSAASTATALRKKLFQRAVIRNVARTVVRRVTGP